MSTSYVRALIYKVSHRTGVRYDKAPPMEFEWPEAKPRFRVRIGEGKARIEMLEPFASVEAAQESVEKFLRAWELHADLLAGGRYAPGEIRFKFEQAEIIDRDDTDGQDGDEVVGRVSSVMPSISQQAVGEVNLYQEAYPKPPGECLAIDPDVDSLRHRYEGYREGREPLASMAYFCLTVAAETAAPGQRQVSGKRKVAAAKYSIDLKVLSKLGELTSTRGGDNARKSEGRGTPLTRKEQEWIEEAVKVLIRRLAEYAADPTRQHKPITVANLPAL